MLAAFLLGAAMVVIAARVHSRRRRVGPARELVEARELAARTIADVAEEARRRDAGDGRAITQAQAEWARSQALITSDSVIVALQGARALIRHAGAAEARALLDQVQAAAEANPEGVAGNYVAAARERFDELMRGNLQ